MNQRIKNIYLTIINCIYIHNLKMNLMEHFNDELVELLSFQ